MRMSISRKLIGGFLSLALLVLVAGLVGIIELKKVSSSADTVANEKAPARYAVMNAVVAVNKIQKNTISYTGAVFGLEKISAQIAAEIDEFNMWITMLRFGTDSDEFRNSPALAVYQKKNITLRVPRSSQAMLPIVNGIVEESNRLRQKTN